MVLLTHRVTKRLDIAKCLTKNVFAYNKTKEYIKDIPNTMFAKLDQEDINVMLMMNKSTASETVKLAFFQVIIKALIIYD
jgi:hypothetical protein